jgi:hypothetical protein
MAPEFWLPIALIASQALGIVVWYYQLVPFVFVFLTQLLRSMGAAMLLYNSSLNNRKEEVDVFAFPLIGTGPVTEGIAVGIYNYEHISQKTWEHVFLVLVVLTIAAIVRIQSRSTVPEVDDVDL